MPAENIKTPEEELNKMADGVLGKSSEPPAEVEMGPDPLFWGMGDLSFDDAERQAYQRMEEYAHQQYGATSKRMVMDGYGGSVVIGGMPLTERMITSLVYETLLQNRDKYFVEPKECSTAATDGEAIYLNPYFAAWLTPQELAFVLAHEINHIMLHHVGELERAETFIYGYKAKKDTKNIDASKGGLYRFRANIANIAEDLIINDQLVKDKIGTLPVFKEGSNKGKPVACYIPGFSNYSTEESIIKFSSAVCKNGYGIVHETFKGKGLDIEPPQYKEIRDVTDARLELEKLYDYICEASAKYCQKQKEANEKKSQQGDPSMGGMPLGAGSSDSGQNSSGQEVKSSQEQQDSQQESKDGNSNKSEGTKKSKGQGSNKEAGKDQNKQQGNSRGKSGRPPLNADGELDSMAGAAIQETINNILMGEMSKDAADKIAEAISNAIAKGMGGGDSLDSHQTTGDLLNEIAKEQNKDPSDVEKQISEASGILASKVIEKLENTYGVTPEQLKGIGSIGANIVAKWEARQVKARRPYDVMLMRLFKLVKGQSRDTYARHNKKTTVINKALKNYAKKTGTEPSRVIIPNKLSESGKIVIAIDTSGSIFADPKVGTMAVEEILRLTDTLNRQYMGSAIEVVMCDTELHKYGLASNRHEMQKMLDNVKTNGVNVLGGGGTDLLPIWEYVMDETKNARKKGQMPPSGLLVLTDTQTMNLDKISDLYKDREVRIPTVILAPSEDIKHCKEWQDLSRECPYFMLADIDEIQQRSQSRASHTPERNFCYEIER